MYFPTGISVDPRPQGVVSAGNPYLAESSDCPDIGALGQRSSLKSAQSSCGGSVSVECECVGGSSVSARVSAEGEWGFPHWIAGEWRSDSTRWQ